MKSRWRSLRALDPDREYVVLASSIPPRSVSSTWRLFRGAASVRKQLAGTEGVVGFSLLARPARKQYATLSVWEDESALAAFAETEPHRTLMHELAPEMGATKFVRWTISGSDGRPSWREALGRLATHDGRRLVHETDYRRTSQDTWDAMARGWDARHRYFEETARPVTERMLERLGPRPGATILDLAAGTGVVGFAAAGIVGPDGRVIVSDFSEAMVDAARRLAAELGLDNIECRVLDAERLDLPSDSVDGVVCRWGYMLMGDPDVAFAETRRVLRDGGCLASAVFAGPAENPWAALPMRVLREHGHVPPAAAGAPGILALADRDRLRKLFVDAGFTQPRIEDVAFTWRFSDADDYWAFLTDVAGAIAMVLRGLGEEERERVREDITAQLTSYVTPRGIELPAVSIVASAF